MTTLAANPSWRQLARSPLLLLAFGFGSGLAPRAPRPAGSVAAPLLWPLLALLPAAQLWVAIAVAALAGIAICGSAAQRLGVHDHGGIVWDEFVGLWLALALLPAGWSAALLGFALFRLFDIAKPWPINWLDRRLGGGLGIMFDDLVAGLLAAASGQLLLTVLPLAL